MEELINSSGQESARSTPREGGIAKQVEQYTGNVPTITYLGFAVGSMVLSASIAALSRRKEIANFIGLWVPTIMLLGVYNKLVKMENNWSSRLH